jgi:signal peptidase I
MPRGFWTALLKIVLFLAVVVGITAAVLRTWFVDVVTVAHNGMAPTMIAGDRVLVWRDARLARNDVALCRHPSDASRWVLGRIAAEEGGGVSVDGRGQLFIDERRTQRDIRGNVRYTESESGQTWPMMWGIEQFGDYEEHYFFERTDRRPTTRPMARVQGLYLLGDNRGHVGEDSRAFGVVHRAQCRGRVFMRFGAAEGLPPEIPHGHLDFID